MIACLVGKLSNLTFKNRLITQVSNRELIVQHGGVLQHSQEASFTGKVEVCHLVQGTMNQCQRGKSAIFPGWKALSY
jgi:hypothetical protein